MFSKQVQNHPRVGFTLVELMVVIVIIGLLAGVVTLSVRGYLATSKQNVARFEMAKVVQALETFYLSNDRYPTSDEGLDLLTKPSAKFREGILSRVPRDPWGRPYQYLSPGRDIAFEIISLGADGREGGTGGDQDLSSKDLSDADNQKN